MKPIGVMDTEMEATSEVQETVIDAALQDPSLVRSSTLEALPLLPCPDTAPEQCVVEVAPAIPQYPRPFLSGLCRRRTVG